ncbi:formate--tetrahydrofolate ligase [Enterococcus hirae]|nr:formate--tetrahydrofolate ligase [Enterococcus hirae]
MKTDIEIAQESAMKPIQEIAEKLGFTMDDLELYGKYKAKVTFSAMERMQDRPLGKLLLVTSINPTPAGEGKSTITIGLADSLRAIGKNAAIALREPSLGPVMGIKGGATGGGYAQVLPMEDINLHFTGDIHAITTANNALSALIDNHLQQGNALAIDSRRITWKRVVDLNDRALRHVVLGLGGPMQGIPREDGFDITVASEIMAILCLAENIHDLKARLQRIVLGRNTKKEPVTVGDLHAQGALALLLKDAIKPNLVQTIYGTPAFIHGGPFANIAHGCNSILATRLALHTADIVLTEAGFGADLGGEKFLDIASPALGKTPDGIVIVATVRALKMHGGLAKDQLTEENLPALRNGFANLQKHIANMRAYGVPVIVAVNKFAQDSAAEVTALVEMCEAEGVRCVPADVWGAGPRGGKALAEAAAEMLDKGAAKFHSPLAGAAGIQDKIERIATLIYGAQKVSYADKAKKQLKDFEKQGWDALPVCMAKTQYSLSDDPQLLGAPRGFTLHIRELVPKLGAGFIVVLTGNVMTMPGLPKKPAALNMDLTDDGRAVGLF